MNAEYAFSNVSFDFLAAGSLNKCYMPCRQKRYLQSLKIYHRTTYYEFDENSFDLGIAYGSLDVTTTTESLVYAFDDFLAAAGGHLGLFLGFSCLTCIWDIIELWIVHFRRN